MKVHVDKEKLKKWSGPFVLALVIALFIRFFLVTPLEINGNSMLPVLHDHDEVLVRHYGTIKRFDIITFKLANGETYIKRVIGLPGDEIKYENNQLYVNQKKVPEKFLTDPNLGETSDFTLDDFFTSTKVPARKYFVLGDNRRISQDSRTLGMVDEKWISGRAWIIYWPIWHFKVL